MADRTKRPFEAVYSEHFSYVYNIMYIHVLNRETAEDLTSDAFIRAYAAYQQYDPGRAAERPWLANIANHLLIDYYRKKASGKVDTVEDEVLAAIPSEDESLEKVTDTANEAVRILLSGLEPQERQLLELRYYEDMKNPEIGALLGINAKAVSERCRRLTDKCRRIAESRNLREWL